MSGDGAPDDGGGSFMPTRGGAMGDDDDDDGHDGNGRGGRVLVGGEGGDFVAQTLATMAGRCSSSQYLQLNPG